MELKKEITKHKKQDSIMKVQTKDILIKLFRKYAQTNRLSETQFLTEQDFRYLIHDESFPIELPIIPKITKALGKLVDEYLRTLKTDRYKEGASYNVDEYYADLQKVIEDLTRIKKYLESK